MIDYSATKGAILAFTRALSGSVVKDGIRVNAVAPGPIWTPLIPAAFPEDKVEGFGKEGAFGTPMGRPGQPEKLAGAYVYLASDDASYVTGQVLHINLMVARLTKTGKGFIWSPCSFISASFKQEVRACPI